MCGCISMRRRPRGAGFRAPVWAAKMICDLWVEATFPDVTNLMSDRNPIR